ncbi:MAG: AcrB/AcrD/AcrF family protein [Candidatus Eisenbacteria bacterium]|nr:AcrB/AcrD/AcrF family protein [Candidatus Latescibacterota bacterium]MBD3303347.1 AcrB/AcrD/AcrF family protein [Candidatus Eisenbacteria bacterium]
MARRGLGISGRVANAFIGSKLTPLLILASLALGVFAVMITPREEEPQITVPMIDVLIPYPGASAREVEERVATPIEKLVWEIPGVEYVYTTSSPSFALAIVRFEVGLDPEESLVKLYTKLMAHPDRIPASAGPPVVKPKSIDDVPIVALTLWSDRYDSFALRKVAEEVALEVKKIDNISEVELIGGERREIRILLDPARLRAHNASALQIARSLEQVNWSLPVGSYSEGNREVVLSAGRFLQTAEDVRQVVVGVRDGRPLRLGEIAEVVDGPAERATYVMFGVGPAAEAKGIPGHPVDAAAVTIAIAKKHGSNAVSLAHAIEEKVDELERTTIPSGVEVTRTRDYGETAQEKSNELILHVLIATVAVVGLILFALGRREAVVVGIAVPVTLALTLMMSTAFGYTLNRVTLFALIFAIGILVDDAIVVVENIHRHFQMRWTSPEKAAVYATDEVGNPTILATFTVIAALLPLAFVSGLMGPYMRPIPINASAAMFFSLLVAFIVTPYVTLRVLKKNGHETAHGPEGPGKETKTEKRIEKVYGAIMRPLIARGRNRAMALGAVFLLLLASTGLLFVRAVPVKMLPYDNKSELQVIVDMPEGSTLEETAAAARALAAQVRSEPEVTDYQVYVGTAAPINFNGLVRHYFLRSGSNVADIQVNLAPKHHRDEQSHAIAKRIRPRLTPIAERYGARIKVAEVPPGPPVLSTMVAEIYGPDLERQREVAARVKQIFESTEGIVDVDWYVDDPQPKLEHRIDPERAALAGITPEMIVRELRMAGAGAEVGLLHTERDRTPVPLVVQVERSDRGRMADLRSISLHAPDGRMVPLSELVETVETTRDRSIYHKNLRRVVYVTGEVAGAEESPIYGILNMKDRVAALEIPEGYEVAQLYSAQPTSEDRLQLKWDGEWQITYEVFRDMGIAFAAVMVLVYVLVVAWFRSFIVPLIIMAPIPLTLIGILPGHWITGLFFTATSMIGFIALAGIIVRNSILLVDFINLELEGGSSIEEAVLKAGAVRFRPIVLTAAALVVGGLVIILDPIFQGLAASLIFGVVVATALTLVVIPLLYYVYLKLQGKPAS